MIFKISEFLAENRQLGNVVYVIGCGYHARRTYIPELSNLKSNRVIETLVAIDICPAALRNKEISDKADFLLLNAVEEMLCAKKLIASLRDLSVSQGSSLAFIISSPPETHFDFIDACAKNEVNCLVDKPPISIPLKNQSLKKISSTLVSYLDILNAKKLNPATRLWCLSQRRMSKPHSIIKNVLSDDVTVHGAYPTAVDIWYGDGQMRPLLENEKINYHGYSDLSGILAHSTYHFVDFLAWLLSEALEEIDQINCICRSKNVYDIGSYHDSLLMGIAADESQEMSGLGEMDCFVLMEFVARGKKICHATLTLQHNSFSYRSWSEAKPNLYKGNGRIRQEKISISQGGFQAIHLVNTQVPKNIDIGCLDKGGSQKLSDITSVEIFRNPLLKANPGLKNLKAHSLTRFGESFPKAQDKARSDGIRQFVSGQDGVIDEEAKGHPLSLNSQKSSVILFALLCGARLEEINGRIGVSIQKSSGFVDLVGLR